MGAEEEAEINVEGGATVSETCICGVHNRELVESNGDRFPAELNGKLFLFEKQQSIKHFLQVVSERGLLLTAHDLIH